MRRKTKIIMAVLVILIGAGLLIWRQVVRQPAYGHATLTWSVEEADSPVQGFKIYWGTTPRNTDCPPGGYAQNVDVGQKYKYTLNHLLAGQTYYFSITGYTQSGEESCFIDRELKKTVTVTSWERLKDFFGRP